RMSQRLSGPPSPMLLKEWIRARRGVGPISAPRPVRPRRSESSLSHPIRGTRCRLLYGPDCVLRRTRRDTLPASTCRRTLDVDAGVVLRESRHFTFAIDRHLKLVDPAGQYSLDVLLPQGEPVGVSGGKVADVQRGSGECRDLR